jgi:2-methylisocitrate lyase-like PEP mutase family enzyme
VSKNKEQLAMTSLSQKDRAEQFRRLHNGPEILVLPNAWDAASSRILEQVGFRAVATTSSGVAVALGYADGEQISREMLVETVARITRVITCPLTVDIESGFGTNIDEVLQTVKMLITAGAVGINIEDSTKQDVPTLVDIAFQTDLIKAIRELASAMDVPLVINARTDTFLLQVGDTAEQFEQAVQRANAYRQAGADCLYPIMARDTNIIRDLVKAIDGPVNILARPGAPTIPELAQLGVARVTFGGGLTRAALGHLRHVAQELFTSGTYTALAQDSLSGAEFDALFEHNAD